jgi:hypothetical protein
MAQVLVFLLNNPKCSGYKLERFFIDIASPTDKRVLPNLFGTAFLRRSAKESFNRTLRIMRKHGLISEVRYWQEIHLTEKGTKIALKLQKRVYNYIRDFSFLVERKPR